MSIVVLVVSVSGAAQARPRLPLEPIISLEVGTHTGGVNQIQASHNRQNIFTVSDDQTLRIWDAHDGQLKRVIRGPAGPRDEGALYALAQSNRFIAVAGRVGWEWGKGTTTVRLLDAKDYHARGVLSGLPAPVSALSFSPDGKYLAAGLKGQRQGLRLYSLGTGKAAIKDLNFPAGLVDLMFLDDGRLIALDGSGLLSFFNVKTLSKIRTLKIPKAQSTWRVSQSSDGRFLTITHQ
ncbi:MAG: hypothetical protein JKY92_04400, partial [Magnetovibrio sp.]|nr:hypothetical protein [Magnetovibrio sp.]